MLSKKCSPETEQRGRKGIYLIYISIQNQKHLVCNNVFSRIVDDYRVQLSDPKTEI